MDGPACHTHDFLCDIYVTERCGSECPWNTSSWQKRHAQRRCLGSAKLNVDIYKGVYIGALENMFPFCFGYTFIHLFIRSVSLETALCWGLGISA